MINQRTLKNVIRATGVGIRTERSGGGAVDFGQCGFREPVGRGDRAGDPLLDEDYLVLSTIHSAKGLEWDAVYVIHAADGNIPSDMATGDAEQIDEERRLFYVALTRAKDHLYVCYPLRYYHVARGPRGGEYGPQTARLSPRCS